MINTYEQNKVWKSDLALWADTIKKSPDPRSMFNYAGAFYTEYKETGDKAYIDIAVKYWNISRDFNLIYGTNYAEDYNKIPYGRVMFMAQHNSKIATMANDGRMRKGWAIPNSLMKNFEIRENNG